MKKKKKKKKEKEIVEEGEVVPQKEPKQQKTTKDKRQAFSVESMEAKHSVDVCYPTWNPQLELDGAAVPGAPPSGKGVLERPRLLHGRGFGASPPAA